MLGFGVGIEVELLLTLRREPSKEIEELRVLANGFVKRYNKEAGEYHPLMHNDVDCSYEGDNITKEWTLIDDCSIRTDPRAPGAPGAPGAKKQWPLEITSPILDCVPDSNWREDVRFLWEVTKDIFIIETNKSCGLHVHLSVPDNQNWAIDRLQQLCRSALWFEKALEALCPESRRGNKWAKSNRLDNPKLKNKTGQECFDLIDQCKHHVDIMDLMNNGGDRYFAWNFTNLQYSHKCTVEWRRGPGVADPETYLDWVELVVAFAGSAIRFGTVDELKDYSQDVEGLKEFINNGLVEKIE